ncbi:uncharacterized protein [Littorina saxatilis]|uniref:uncharacterized protein isoform X2 n=1 Tax=Littorina saxatilis TaxID=31220 RepID=UPI0038B4EA01
MIMNVLHEVTVVAVVLCLTMTGAQPQTRESRSHRDHAPSRRNRRTVNNDLLGFFSGQGHTLGDTADYMHYTPSTPAPADINCYVEVPTTERTGGRCIQLGLRGRARNRPWACQAGVHLAFSADCPNQSGRGRRTGRGG